MTEQLKLLEGDLGVARLLVNRHFIFLEKTPYIWQGGAVRHSGNEFGQLEPFPAPLYQADCIGNDLVAGVFRGACSLGLS